MAPRPEAAEARRSVPSESVLRLVSVRPADGSLVRPVTAFAFEFDRPLAQPSRAPRWVSCEYVGGTATFISDPFRLTSTWLSPGGETLFVQPPALLPGQRVRISLLAAVRGADGSRLSADPLTPPEAVVLTLTHQVMDLPP